MHLKTTAEKLLNRNNILSTQSKTLKSLHMIFENIKAHNVSLQLKNGDEYAL